MRLGVFHGSGYYLHYYSSALEPLVDAGHVLVLARPASKRREVYVPKSLRGSAQIERAHYPNRRGGDFDRAVKVLRLARDVVRYESPPLRDAYANRRRAWRHFLRAIAHGAHEGDPGAWPATFALGEGELAAVSAALARIEAIVPPNERLVRFVQELELDVAVCIGRVNFGGDEAEVVAAARAANVPSAIVVYSWDNLSSKALIHRHPDRLFVWNDVQVREAVELHGLDERAVVATGAPRFDSFFGLRPSATRDELHARLGLDPAQATLLYLGSSGFVTKHEPDIVERWVETLRAGADERVARANVVVRPHPGAFDEPHWVGWRPTGERVVLPEIRKREQELYDQIWMSDAVVALNTSAEIEAAIVGRPVLTFDAGDLAPGQEGATHFRYLLADAGGFVEHAATLDEHRVQLARALAADPHADARRGFLARFVRPLGIDEPAGPALAREIEQLARVVV